jgi:hypothetical protein
MIFARPRVPETGPSPSASTGSDHTDAAHGPCPWRISRAGQYQVGKHVPLLESHNFRSGPGAIQREFRRPERGPRMLLANRDLRPDGSNAGCRDGVQPGSRHTSRPAEAPDGSVQWAYFKEDGGTGGRPEEPVQFRIILCFLLQDLRIAVGLEGSCVRRPAGCRRGRRSGSGR